MTVFRCGAPSVFFYFLLCNVSINAHVEQYWCYGSPKHPKGVSDLVGYIERYSRLSIKKDKLYNANYQNYPSEQ